MVYWIRFLAFWQRFMDKAQVIFANLRTYLANTAKVLERFIYNLSKL